MAKSAAKGKEAAAKTKAAKAAGPVPKAPAKKTPAKNGTKKMTKGEQYSCEVCGVVVTVDEACGCAEAHDIICCGQAMTAKK